jgi:hypothetical protein
MTDLRTLRAAPLDERLAIQSIPEPNSGCLLWLGSVNRYGYGYAIDKRRSVLAHRAAWEQENGPIPGGLLVCHKCDVRSCINPAHLFLGSAADNAQDMARKGRAPEGAQNGELHGRSKLTDEQVRAIRRDSRPLAAIAAEHGVSDSLISRIRNRHLWPHL